MSGRWPVQLPPRPADGHKGTFGTVCVVGGQCAGPRVMIGGPTLTALAALRSGCGLCVLAMPTPILSFALSIVPSATGLALPVDESGALVPSAAAELLDPWLASFHCIALGPALGAEMQQQQVVHRLVSQGDVPVVIDADGLNALANLRGFARDMRAPAVVTPHVGEFRRLAQALQIELDPTDPTTRTIAAETLARRLGCVVVLKGPGTVVTDGVITHVNETGSVALATAGSGDVLTGIIAGFISQFRGIPGVGLLQCAMLGVHVHGLAADRWAAMHGKAGLLATDLTGLLPEVMHEARERVPSLSS